MVTALIFAGGTGVRMNSNTIPKQFLELHGKPILIHTIEWFEKHEMVDNIVVVCLENWIHNLENMIAKFEISKVSRIVVGGSTAQESIFNGLKAMKDSVSDDDIVLIHDGVRPLITKELITNNIKSVEKNGNAISVSYVNETIIENCHDIDNQRIPNRELLRIARAPQSFYYKEVFEGYNKASVDGFSFIDSSTLMLHYGHKLYPVYCESDNIKITTPIDYYMFKAVYEAREQQQIFGVLGE